MTEADEILRQAFTLDEIKEALNMGADVNAPDKHGQTILFRAQTDEIAEFLVKEAGADVNITDDRGDTALVYAKTEKQTKLHLEAGAKIGIDKALVWAKTAGQTKLLLEAGADPNYRVDGLSAADNANSAEQLQILRSSGAIIEIGDKQLERWKQRFESGNISSIPEEAMQILGQYEVDMIERVMQNGNALIDNDRLVGITHALCHIYENGNMAYKSCRIVGDLILDKLIEKAELGYMSYANRSIDGYWQSIKDNPESWEGLKAILEKHPDYAFGQKYLGYMNGEEPEDAETLKDQYLQNPNMLFVTTMLTDVDGTLIQDGKINTLLIEKLDIFESYHTKKMFDDPISHVAVYTGGDPQNQKEVLLKAAAENILENFPSLRKTYTVDAIINIHSENSETNLALRKDLLQNMKDDVKNDRSQAYLAKLEAAKSDAEKEEIEWQHERLGKVKLDLGKKMLKFIERLNSENEDQIKIYPKQAFMQENICLAGIVVDDTQPAAQEMKSLSMAVLNPGESSLFVNSHQFAGGEDLEVPDGRKITAQQVFDMYKQKQIQAQKSRYRIEERTKRVSGKKDTHDNIASQNSSSHAANGTAKGRNGNDGHGDGR